MEATLATLLTLQRHRGHFLNWYDTQTCSPLLPMYVSTVDSGYLSGHLLAAAQACLELAHAPHDTGSAQRALQASRQRLAPLLALWSDLLPTLLSDAAIARLLALPDPLAECRHNAVQFELLLRAADDELAALLSQKTESVAPVQATPRDELLWRPGDPTATLP